MADSIVIACIKDLSREEKMCIQSRLDNKDELYIFDSYEELEQSDRLEDIEVVFGEPSISLIEKMKSLRWIQMTWAGTDMYTRHEGFTENVVLTNASGAFGKIISEYVLAGILSMNRQLFAYREEIQAGGWHVLNGEQTLEGKTALILGTGDIGCEIARKLQAFDVKVLGIRRTKQEKPVWFDEMYMMDDLENLLPEVDIVISCLPGTKQTERLLSKDRLLMMRKDAMLVNVGRGSLIPMEDLMEVLEMGHLRSVVLDVLETEPCPKNHPLRKCDRVLLTPHISGVSWGDIAETRQKIVDIFCKNIEHYKKDEMLEKVVDRQQGY